MEENISMRGRLIKDVLQNYWIKNIWDKEINEESINKELNNHLNFEVDIKLTNKINGSSINVYFEDENEQKRQIDFTISPKLSIFKDTILI